MDPRSHDPKTRLRVLVDYANSVKIEKSIPIQRYYRSGTEMLRMADIYYNEGSTESAYILYLKFLTIFVEKITEHPGYRTLHPAEKTVHNTKIKEVFPKTETLKKQLTELYEKEYDDYQKEEARRKRKEELRIQKEMEALKLKKEEEERRKQYNEMRDRLLENSLAPPPQTTLPLLPIQHVDNVPKNFYPSPEVPDIPVALIAAAKEVPDFDRNLKPRSVFFSPSGLRKLVIPASLIDEFVMLAQYNTDNNVETCGFLAGNLANNRFNVTHLLIPKQRGTSDSCTTENEEELFAVQDKHHLVTLGWIHTHPTQTAFLSSVDLHTHCPYQLMMPEAVAVVCAPKYNETGYFSLTPNHGLELIASCHQQGFHPHPTNPPLFETASHVEIHPSAPVNVIDLRRR